MYECLYNIYFSFDSTTYANIKSISLICMHIIKKITSYLSGILSRQRRGVYRSLSRYVLNTISPSYPLNGFLNLKRTMQEGDAIFTIFLAHLIHLESGGGHEMAIIRRWMDAIAWWFAFRECRLSFASCSPNWLTVQSFFICGCNEMHEMY